MDQELPLKGNELMTSKVYPVTVHQLNEIVKNYNKNHNTYAKVSFDYVSIIGRAYQTSKGVNCLMDSTGIYLYPQSLPVPFEFPTQRRIEKLISEPYYQFLLKADLVSMKYQFKIISYEPVEGNSIVLHMTKMIQVNLLAEVSYLQWINNENSNTAIQKRDEKKLNKLCNQIKKWIMKNHYYFFKREVKEKFPHQEYSRIEAALVYMEDEKMLVRSTQFDTVTNEQSLTWQWFGPRSTENTEHD